MKQTTPLTFNHKLTFTTTRKRRGRWFFLALLFPLMGGVLAHVTLQATSAPAPVAMAPAADTPAAAPAPAAVPAEPPSKIDVVVRRNDTIEGIFRNLNLSAADLNSVLNVPGVGPSFKQLKPGDKMTLVHDGAVLHAINRHISESEVLSVTRGASGFAAERIVTLE